MNLAGKLRKVDRALARRVAATNDVDDLVFTGFSFGNCRTVVYSGTGKPICPFGRQVPVFNAGGQDDGPGFYL